MTRAQVTYGSKWQAYDTHVLFLIEVPILQQPDVFLLLLVK